MPGHGGHSPGPGDGGGGGGGGGGNNAGNGGGGQGSNYPFGIQNGSRGAFAVDLLNALGAPVTQADIEWLLGWMARENTTASFNPLAITVAPGTNFNSVGVKNIPSWNAGVAATAHFLTTYGYGGIVSSLKTGNPSFGGAVGQELLRWSGNGYSSFGVPGSLNAGYVDTNIGSQGGGIAGGGGGGGGPSGSTGPGFGQPQTSRAELNYILQGYGLDPSQFSGLISQAIQNQWTDAELLGHIYASPMFHHTFPGIFAPDGSLKMTPAEYLQLVYGEGGYTDIAKSYGINLGRQQAGLLIGNDVSPTEFTFRANVFKMAKTNDVFRQSINQVLKAQGQDTVNQGAWFKHVMGISDARIENLYEAATLNAAPGLDINAKQALAAGKTIGANPLEQVDLRSAVEQALQIKNFIGPELSAAGITDADLAVMQAGSDPKGLGAQLQQILRNRQALVGFNSGTVTSAGGGIFPTPVGAVA